MFRNRKYVTAMTRFMSSICWWWNTNKHTCSIAYSIDKLSLYERIISALPREETQRARDKRPPWAMSPETLQWRRMKVGVSYITAISTVCLTACSEKTIKAPYYWPFVGGESQLCGTHFHATKPRRLPCQALGSVTSDVVYWLLRSAFDRWLIVPFNK